MFKNVLIAEDQEMMNLSLRKTLIDLSIPITDNDYVFYCDDALMRIQKALREGKPYELMVTDISFEEDIPGQKVIGGLELIKAVRLVQPFIKILVFSIENRAFVANSLIKELGINAYVPKGRNDARELRAAIEAVYKNKIYLSSNLKKTILDHTLFKFTEFDIIIISLISRGESQKNIPIFLKNNNITPSGLSSVEKRLNSIRTALNFSNNEQLIAYCKDNKII